MKGMLVLIFACFLLVQPNSRAYGQLFGKKKQYGSSMATKDGNRRGGKGDRKILYILTLNPRKMMTGNACVTNYTRKLGFEYAGNFDSPGEEMNSAELLFRNFWTRTKLTFRNGPFWSCKVHRRIRECRQSSGEFLD